ncbi:uncharacterized protein LOC111628334 [Centruroides sculpturatus]|uniref:uncharacterized protein LOC111628334 n=1 Tax=Centruroides sculpturatus TaxID=218467 RepID=UPI000C6D3C9C|nr:uncharacterized protein LOC111628334 [Centruroides sculpturatus]
MDGISCLTEKEDEEASTSSKDLESFLPHGKKRKATVNPNSDALERFVKDVSEVRRQLEDIFHENVKLKIMLQTSSCIMLKIEREIAALSIGGKALVTESEIH